MARKNQLSLATFKPKEVINLIAEPVVREWPSHKVDTILEQFKQKDLFGENELDSFRLIPKLPYKFSYQFSDKNGRRSTLMIEDWEIGQLFWNCLKAHDEAKAISLVREKYLNELALERDLYLFLGTTFLWHQRKGSNPFVIVGLFYPPFTIQEEFGF